MGGRDHPDNAERFAFFSRAVLELMRALDFSPSVYHCNDWQTACTTYLRSTYRVDPEFQTPVYCSPSTTWLSRLFKPATMAVANLGSDLFTPFGVEFTQGQFPEGRSSLQ